MNELLDQLTAITCAIADEPTRLPRCNPRPPGVLIKGSASDAVLKYLIEAGGFKTEAQILWKVRRSHSAVSWACLYLLRQGLIEARPDVIRNSRYKKYRAARKVLAQANGEVAHSLTVLP